ncbi:ribosome small subunit-dependent GTPase A [Ileibacterium valens]|uniref:ribosome small subunit-dependent GTPase A n=1 Tax=Ileibacterium valens TaxID=1862668 RepID=UPI00272C0CBE|nr:ribosome small subunit-dependent GTPase A [Ileibacterium valens]
MPKARIIKIISNQYTIQDGQRISVAAVRGKQRLKFKPAVGDLVEYEDKDDQTIIMNVLPRMNHLLRPFVANVDQALIVTSMKDPDYSEHLLNRLIFLSLLANIRPRIVVTKSDMMDEESRKKIEEDLRRYEKAGYDVFYSHPGSDDELLEEILKDKVSVLCGQSGAGKSSLLNRLDPNFHLRTQEISKALGRGRHTTRHCELHPVAGGLVADTPGFSSLDFTRLDVSDLDSRIPDFEQYIGECRFADCRHLKEPGCAVKEALQEGRINPSIYEDYYQILTEADLKKKQY